MALQNIIQSITDILENYIPDSTQMLTNNSDIFEVLINISSVNADFVKHSNKITEHREHYGLIIVQHCYNSILQNSSAVWAHITDKDALKFWEVVIQKLTCLISEDKPLFCMIATEWFKILQKTSEKVNKLRLSIISNLSQFVIGLFTTPGLPIRYISGILEEWSKCLKVPRSHRIKQQVFQTLESKFYQVGQLIKSSGDFYVQSNLIECVLQYTGYQNADILDSLAQNWFPEHKSVITSFSTTCFKDFESASREFLNGLNITLNPQNVCSVKCTNVEIDDIEALFPLNSDTFWVDFNFGSESISLLCGIPTFPHKYSVLNIYNNLADKVIYQVYSERNLCRVIISLKQHLSENITVSKFIRSNSYICLHFTADVKPELCHHLLTRMFQPVGLQIIEDEKVLQKNRVRRSVGKVDTISPLGSSSSTDPAKTLKDILETCDTPCDIFSKSIDNVLRVPLLDTVSETDEHKHSGERVSPCRSNNSSLPVTPGQFDMWDICGRQGTMQSKINADYQAADAYSEQCSSTVRNLEEESISESSARASANDESDFNLQDFRTSLRNAKVSRADWELNRAKDVDYMLTQTQMRDGQYEDADNYAPISFNKKRSFGATLDPADNTRNGLIRQSVAATLYNSNGISESSKKKSVSWLDDSSSNKENIRNPMKRSSSMTDVIKVRSKSSMGVHRNNANDIHDISDIVNNNTESHDQSPNLSEPHLKKSSLDEMNNKIVAPSSFEDSRLLKGNDMSDNSFINITKENDINIEESFEQDGDSHGISVVFDSQNGEGLPHAADSSQNISEVILIDDSADEDDVVENSFMQDHCTNTVQCKPSPQQCDAVNNNIIDKYQQTDKVLPQDNHLVQAQSPNQPGSHSSNNNQAQLHTTEFVIGNYGESNGNNNNETVQEKTKKLIIPLQNKKIASPRAILDQISQQYPDRPHQSVRSSFLLLSQKSSVQPRNKPEKDASNVETSSSHQMNPKKQYKGSVSPRTLIRSKRPTNLATDKLRYLRLAEYVTTNSNSSIASSNKQINNKDNTVNLEMYNEETQLVPDKIVESNMKENDSNLGNGVKENVKNDFVPDNPEKTVIKAVKRKRRLYNPALPPTVTPENVEVPMRESDKAKEEECNPSPNAYGNHPCLQIVLSLEHNNTQARREIVKSRKRKARISCKRNGKKKRDNADTPGDKHRDVSKVSNPNAALVTFSYKNINEIQLNPPPRPNERSIYSQVSSVKAPKVSKKKSSKGRKVEKQVTIRSNNKKRTERRQLEVVVNKSENNLRDNEPARVTKRGRRVQAVSYREIETSFEECYDIEDITNELNSMEIEQVREEPSVPGTIIGSPSSIGNFIRDPDFNMSSEPMDDTSNKKKDSKQTIRKQTCKESADDTIQSSCRSRGSVVSQLVIETENRTNPSIWNRGWNLSLSISDLEPADMNMNKNLLMDVSNNSNKHMQVNNICENVNSKDADDMQHTTNRKIPDEPGLAEKNSLLDVMSSSTEFYVQHAESMLNGGIMMDNLTNDGLNVLPNLRTETDVYNDQLAERVVKSMDYIIENCTNPKNLERHNDTFTIAVDESIHDDSHEELFVDKSVKSVGFTTPLEILQHAECLKDQSAISTSYATSHYTTCTNEQQQIANEDLNVKDVPNSNYKNVENITKNNIETITRSSFIESSMLSAERFTQKSRKKAETLIVSKCKNFKTVDALSENNKVNKRKIGKISDAPLLNNIHTSNISHSPKRPKLDDVITVSDDSELDVNNKCISASEFNSSLQDLENLMNLPPISRDSMTQYWLDSNEKFSASTGSTNLYSLSKLVVEDIQKAGPLITDKQTNHKNSKRILQESDESSSGIIVLQNKQIKYNEDLFKIPNMDNSNNIIKVPNNNYDTSIISPIVFTQQPALSLESLPDYLVQMPNSSPAYERLSQQSYSDQEEILDTREPTSKINKTISLKLEEKIIEPLIFSQSISECFMPSSKNVGFSSPDKSLRFKPHKTLSSTLSTSASSNFISAANDESFEFSGFEKEGISGIREISLMNNWMQKANIFKSIQSVERDSMFELSSENRNIQKGICESLSQAESNLADVEQLDFKRRKSDVDSVLRSTSCVSQLSLAASLSVGNSSSTNGLDENLDSTVRSSNQNALETEINDVIKLVEQENKIEQEYHNSLGILYKQLIELKTKKDLQLQTIRKSKRSRSYMCKR